MQHFVEGSKYQVETISIVQSFLDMMEAGDSITGTPTISVTVSSGIDPTPSLILYEGVTVTNGNTVEQRFRTGIPGVIYHITFTILTAYGYNLDKSCYLAILPEDGIAIPNFLPLWESTQLYPIYAVEQYKAQLSLTGGGLIIIVIPYSFLDSYQTSLSLLSGNLHNIVVPYSLSEQYKASLLLSSGTLVEIVIPYALSEQYKTSLALISGTLTVVVIPYSLYDSYQTSLSLTSGSLT